MADMTLLKKLMADLDEDAVLERMREIAENSGDGAADAVDACQEGMRDVGERFESGEYFIGDLIFAGEIMSGAMEIIKPFLGAGASGGQGRLILCTVQGDIHDIGKNIVKSMFDAAGFDVVDLGIDVSPEKIVETVKAEDIRIVALSGVLTLALDSMKSAVDALRVAGLREQVKIIIGGNPVTAETCRVIGADAWAHSPQKGVNICLDWAAERRT